MSVLQVQDLKKTYGKIQALKGVSFEIPQGAVFGILGPNGSGKTTMLSIILDVLNADSGTYSWFGKPASPDLRKHIGSLLETPNFYHYLSAVNNLKITNSISGRGDAAAIDAVLQKVKLYERRNSKFSSYSLGMKQRLAIAAALLGDPQILVLDEPTNGLDPQGIADIRNLILLLSEKMQKTVLVSSHLLSEIEQIANRMLIIDKGKKLVEGTVKELFHPDDTVVYVETGDKNACEQLIKTSLYVNKFLGTDASGIELKLRKEEVPALTRFLVERGVEVLGVTARHTLEDYFLKITTANQHVEPFKN